MPKVLCTPTLLWDGKAECLQILRQAGFEPLFPDPNDDLRNPQRLRRYVEQVEAILASVEPYTAEVMQGTPLRVIARMGVGYDAIDVPAATELGVAVTITPGTNEHSVAEHTLMLMLGVYRGLPWRYKQVQTGRWTKTPWPRFAGKTVGLVGLGRIGRAVVPRCQALGARVIAFDPFADPEWAQQHQVQLCSTLEELLRTADIVSLHCPATQETHHLINRETLALMKPRSVLINTARGSLVDETALAEALRSGHLLGAGLDVFEQEPLPTDSPLLQLDNALLLPHMAGLDEESVRAMGNLAAQCIVDLYQGRWPEGCVVNDQLRSGWSWQRTSDG